MWSSGCRGWRKSRPTCSRRSTRSCWSTGSTSASTARTCRKSRGGNGRRRPARPARTCRRTPLPITCEDTTNAKPQPVSGSNMPFSLDVNLGLDVWWARELPLPGPRVGLVTHQAAVGVGCRSAVGTFAAAKDVELVALFGPEHGLTGEAQDLIPVREPDRAPAGPRVHSLYGETFESLKPTPQMLRGLDALVIDL